MVSHGGGVEPRWRADGAELFYLNLSGRIVAVPVESRAPFRAGPPAVLFATRLTATISPGLLGRNQYDVTPDGARFLIREMSPSALTLVAQWPFLLREARQEGGLAQRP